MCLSHFIHYQHVSTAVTVIIRVIYKITRSHKQLQCISEPLTVKRMSPTSYIVAECQLIKALKI